MSTELHNVLQKARHKIKDEQNWTQGTFARDERGNPVETKSELAVRWCAMGAIESCTDDRRTIGDIEKILKDIVEADSGYMGSDADNADFPSISSFNYFNDQYATHKDILGVFDRALEKV